MNIIGIVCEYNPFHQGHAYQMAKSREALGEDALILCVMSGDYVQRGEPALFSKFARAEAACRCGANLVFELPLPWALSSAEGFARGGVSLLAALGCTHISFGSECGALDELEQLAHCLAQPEIMETIKARMRAEPSLSFAAARQAVLEARLGAAARQIETPNNILAVEYLKAVNALAPGLTPFTLKRMGCAHDAPGGTEMKSAAELRKRMARGQSIAADVPARAMEVYTRELEQGRAVLDKAAVELALLSRLRMLQEEDYLSLAGSEDGIGRRLCKAAKEEPSLEQVLAAGKTRRIAMARLRRMCLCAALGLDRTLAEGLPPYARLLAADKRGRDYLREMDGKTAIPVLTKPAHIKDMGDRENLVFARGALAHDLYVLFYSSEKEKKGGADWRTGPNIV